MSGQVIFDPLVPMLWVYGLGGLGVLAVLAAALLRLRGALWRLAFLAILGAIIVHPQWVVTQKRALNDMLVLLVDESESMGVDGRTADVAAARKKIEALVAADPTLDMVTRTVSQDRSGTRLFEAIKRARGAVPPGQLAGMIVLSDGRAHDGGEAVEKRTKTPAPVHVLLAGDRQNGDRRLRILNAPKFTIVGQDARFVLRIDDDGQPPAATALLTLRVGGGAARQVRVTVGKDVPVSMPISKRGGNIVEISVAPAKEELSLINNRAAVQVNGIRERLRVLLVTGEPYAGVRAWRNLLKSDPAVDLVHFTILRPPLKLDATPVNEMALIAFPTRALFVEKLKSFDLVIFDRYTRRGVLPMIYLDNVARYVEKGGALLVVSGPEFAGPFSLSRTPLAAVLPARPLGDVDSRPFRPSLTKTGMRHPVTAPLAGRQKSWGHWGRRIAAVPVSGAVVMGKDEHHPLLMLDRVGEGRVALFLSDQAWLWARGFDGGGPHAELYRRLAHWLMREPELEEEALRAVIKGKTLSITYHTLADTPPPAQLTAPGGTQTTLALAPAGPGVFGAQITVPATGGLYSVHVGDLLALAAQGEINPPEYANLMPDDQALRPLVDASDGGFFWLRAGDVPTVRRTEKRDRQRGRNWLGLRRNHAFVVLGQTRKNLIPALPFSFLLGLLALLIWWREGRR